MDSAFVLRVPEQYAALLEAMIDEDSFDELGLSFDEGTRALNVPHALDFVTASLRIGSTELDGSVQDLPTFVEVMRGLDAANYIKTGDLAQVVVFAESSDKTSSNVQSLSGLTPPTEFISRRRDNRTGRVPSVRAWTG
jgi:hypothetical protein